MRWPPRFLTSKSLEKGMPMFEENTSTLALDSLRELLVVALLAESQELREGVVMTMGPPPYRRIDCNGRAVVYLRSRPRRKAVRADMSGLWVICPNASARAAGIMIRSATGGASLMLSSEDHIKLAVDLIVESVNYTLALEEEYKNRHTAFPGLFEEPKAA